MRQQRSLSFVLRTQRSGFRLWHIVRHQLGLNRTVYVDQRLDEYRAYWEAATQLLGGEFRSLSDGVWEARIGAAVVRIAGHVVPSDDPVTLRLAGDKELVYRLAETNSVPVPRHLAFTLGELDTARAFLLENGGPLVVKPLSGTSSGLGITTHVTDWTALKRGALLASLYGSRLLLERMVPAESCRLLFLDGELVHAVRRRGVRVTGDGKRRVADLVGASGVPADETTRLTLTAQGMSLDFVPARGREIVARCLPAGVSAHRELRTIYNETITGIVGPELIAQAARIVAAVGARFAGVDILTNDPAQTLADAGGVFLEVNTTPGIHHHYQTDEERKTHPVAIAVLRSLVHSKTSPNGGSVIAAPGARQGQL